jgi:SAM-dependent methyltransferase
MVPEAGAEPPELVWARERAHHDAMAGELDMATLGRDWTPDRLGLALLDLAGDVRGLAVLDAGCGQGDLTMRLLEQGARATALDISPGMIDVVRERAKRKTGDVDSFAAVAAPLEQSGLGDHTFDLVVGYFVLHHIDIHAGAQELRRLLRPGGRAIFVENTGNNPALAFARRFLTGRWGIPRFGTKDEHPLTAQDLDDLRGLFARVTAHHPVFEFLVLFDRQVLRFRFPRVSSAIRRFDDTIYRRFPPLRRFSYRVIVELTA